MTDFCKVCLSERIIAISGHSKDLAMCEYYGLEHEGYLPDIDNVCGGDDINIVVCLECGQLQGKWPVPDPQKHAWCEGCETEVEMKFTASECPDCGGDLELDDEWKDTTPPEPMEKGGFCDAKIGKTKCRLLVPFDFEGLPPRPIGHEMVVEKVTNGTLTVTFAGQVLELTIGEHVELI